jgi:hypothetical protein
MPFIGNQPALSYTSFAKQDFTTSATTSYTLDNPVTNENELALFINFVRQEPTTAYTATGTSLTLTSATSASDDMYCVFLGKAVQTVNPPSGSVGLSQLSATGTKDSTTFLRGDNTFASAGGANTPAFEAKITSAPSVSQATLTVLAYNAENFDTDSAYDTSTYKFTPQSAGKYFVYAKARINDAGDNDNNQLQIHKNTTNTAQTLWRAEYFESPFLGAVIDLNGSSDFVQIKVYHNFAGTKTIDTDGSVFGAYKIIE